MVFGKHVNKFYLRYALLFLLGVLSLALVDYIQLIIPEVYKLVINGINDGFVWKEGVKYEFNLDFILDSICLPLCFVAAAIVFLRFSWRICLFGLSTKVVRDLRLEMFDHAKDLSQQYYQVNKVGNLMSLFTNDLDTIQDCFGDGILMTCDATLLGAFAFIKMFRMSWILSLFSLIPLACLLIASIVVGKKMSEKWDERQAKFSALSDFSQESFTGIAVIKAFAKERKELRAFQKLNKENEKVNVEYTKLNTLLDVLIEFFGYFTIGLILLGGGYFVYQDLFNAGELIEFISYYDTLIWPILAVSLVIDSHARGKASYKRIADFLEAKIDVRDHDDVVALQKRADAGDEEARKLLNPEIKGGVRFRHLNFTYPNSEREVLTNVSFSIEPGEQVGIVGGTGCGKTTIVDLLTRTYEVKDGSVFVDDIDVNRIPIKILRSHMAYVPQDNFLFSQSIEENIAFAFEDASDEKAIREAAALSDVDSNIREFPEQYKTVLGERGVTVSGGQKQRISIARALMKNAEILILDDSVSAVDTKTEKEILENLKKARRGRTTILIAHRITTIEHMDKIIFMENGRISDIGTHEELYDRCPAYREMVDLQRLEDEKKEVNA